jgi:hypothetical protein
MSSIGGGSKQPGGGQLPHRSPNGVWLQAGDLDEKPLRQRTARHRQRVQHRPRVRTASNNTGDKQLRQPGRQRHWLCQLPRVGGRGGHQLLGKKRMPLRACEHLLHQPTRRRCAHQHGDLLGHLSTRQRAEPDLLHPRIPVHMCQPVGHRDI